MNQHGPFCNCSRVQYCGPLCMDPLATCDAKQRERAVRQEDAFKASISMDALNKQKAMMCTNTTKRMLCPKELSTGLAGTCVGALAECFTTALEMTNYKAAKELKCAAGEKYCDQQGICLGWHTQCAPANMCSGATPYRCASWACAADAAGCEAGIQPPACGAGEQRCPDGLCYPENGGPLACIYYGTQWDGCPPGTMQCKGGERGVCASDEASCANKVGCAWPLIKCGWKRDPSTGKPKQDPTSGKLVPDCQTNCSVGLGPPVAAPPMRPPKDITQALDPRTGGQLEAKSQDGRNSAVKIQMPTNAFKVGDRFDKPVNFSITSVPDSLVQHGPFAKHFERGALLGALITIQPSAEVDIVGGMTLDIPMLDSFANSDDAKCRLFLQNSKMLAIKDINNVSEVPESLGTCVKGDMPGCWCRANLTHFSTFAVVDDTVNYYFHKKLLFT